MDRKSILMMAIAIGVALIATVVIIVISKQKQKSDSEVTKIHDSLDHKRSPVTSPNTDTLTVIKWPRNDNKSDGQEPAGREKDFKTTHQSQSGLNAVTARAITPDVDLSPFNGAKYTQLSTNYGLSFIVISKNKLQFSGKMCGYNITGVLTYVDNMNFKVSGSDAGGSISFLDNSTKVAGTMIIKSTGLSCPVDLIKVNE